MKETSPGSESYLHRIRSWTQTKAHGPSSLSESTDRPSTLPLSNLSSISPKYSAAKPRDDAVNIPPFPSNNLPGFARQSSKSTANNVADKISSDHPPPAPPPQADAEGAVIDQAQPNSSTNNNSTTKERKNVAARFWLTSKSIILSSYVNILLVFVPIGIASKAAGLKPGIVFGMNAIAIIPLAGLLSHATESVAKRMGDTIGALMNVTFGNAVELIIFIALTKNEIRIVQASLLGSILANLLLILGMCFLIGGLRFREQIYNSTVTQMSACLLSLSVMSLLLPTAFHASFNTENKDKAERDVLKVSRGTSVILLLVYGLYLLFQLKSHAYMYESTPQHILDEEMAPGPVAQWMESSSDDSSSSSSSDSDTSSGSNTTAKKFKRVIRGGKKRRKSSAGSKESADEAVRTPSLGKGSVSPGTSDAVQDDRRSVNFADEGEDGDDEHRKSSRRNSFIGNVASKRQRKKERKRQEKTEKRQRRRARRNGGQTIIEDISTAEPEKTAEAASDKQGPDGPRRVDFAVVQDAIGDASELGRTDSPSKRPFNMRHITHIRPQMPKTFSQNVFTHPTAPGVSANPPGPIPRVRYGIRRTNSLPDRLNETGTNTNSRNPSTSLQPVRVSSLALSANRAPTGPEDEENISRTTAVFLLLISTGLVAVCAEFLVDSINAVVEGNSGLSEAFIGLIILPIVGNAAEHVTAVTVASKNKMDLAIGVAVGSSIQIALFVTPLIVLLGWCMSKDMTLYFTLFETVCLFVSAFIVNFLVLDGRSNYLEGALLCASYVIISVAAFFYPNVEDQSNLGGNADASSKMIRDVVRSLFRI